jgi:hypothetical protein
MTVDDIEAMCMGLKKFRKKPVQIMAVKLTKSNINAVAVWCGGHSTFANSLAVPTIEGTMEAKPEQHYIVKGVAGEFYPVRVDIFKDTYEDVVGDG